MKLNSIFRGTGVYCLICYIIFVFGCSNTRPPTEPLNSTPCQIPEGKRLAEVVKETKYVLGNGACNDRFDEFFENILVVGEQDSKPENKELLSSFIEWCYKEGILYKNTAREYYGAFFSRRFISLEKYPKICSQCEKMEEIKASVNDELIKKKRGLLLICEDEGSYNNAVNTKMRGILVLQATCESCSD